MNTVRYHAYLLRIWCAGTPAHLAWRASLEDPHSRQVTGFATPEALLAFLRAMNIGSDTWPTAPTPIDHDETGESSPQEDSS